MLLAQDMAKGPIGLEVSIYEKMSVIDVKNLRRGRRGWTGFGARLGIWVIKEQ